MKFKTNQPSFLLFAFCLLNWLLVWPTSAQGSRILFNQYHDQAFIAEYLRQQARDHSDLATFKVLGKSLEKREIAVLVLSKGPIEGKPAIYINGTHHGNEKASTEAALGLIDYLIHNQKNLLIEQFLSRYAIFIQPLVNPDGHARNSRFDSKGRDPNRDYAHPNRPAEQAFRLKETQLVRELLRRHRFVASAAYHSGMEAVLWPWCHSKLPTPDQPAFSKLGQVIADAMNFSLFTQSYHDYHTEGEFIDYAYMEHGIYALTMEVSKALNPRPELLPLVVQRSVKGTLAYLSALEHILKSQLQSEAVAH